MVFSREKLSDIFSYHQPSLDDLEKYNKINEAFLNLAQVIEDTLPDGPGKTVAIRTLSETRMIANHAISMKGEF